MTPADLLAVPGVPETRIDAATAATLPADAPGAPWDCASTGVLWLARGGRCAARAAGGAIAGRALFVLGGMIAYQQTPVGRYSEVFGGVGARDGRTPAVSIPFMAVDSLDSLVGGRQNWSLPKCVARFSGEPVAGVRMTADGDGWTVRAQARPIGPPLPVRTKGRVVQRWPDGTVRGAVLTGRSRARLAVVTVDVTSDGSLFTWLRSGRHLGVVLTDITFTLPVAR